MNIDRQSDSGADALRQATDLDLREPSMAGAAFRRKRFRWRVIFGAILMFFGLIFFVTYCVHFAWAAKLFIQGVAPWAMSGHVMAGDIVGILEATSIVVSAIYLQKGRWSYATMFFSIGAILGYFAHTLGGGC
jgi:hypothetical protein